jgi:hypothetical protein
MVGAFADGDFACGSALAPHFPPTLLVVNPSARAGGIDPELPGHEDEVAAYAKRVIRLLDGHIVSDERRSLGNGVAALSGVTR